MAYSVTFVTCLCFLWQVKILPDEYYLFSSNGYALAAVWSLLWQ